ncbi:helix-turn-helix domain-containing protein [Stenotrophomonas maltophilia]|nr:helix-turn-helix transcriptional regulator [Stenotrophomonas maltophilia]
MTVFDALGNAKAFDPKGPPHRHHYLRSGTSHRVWGCRAGTYEAEPAIAFGAAVREERTNQGIAQETLAHMAGIERSHMGKIERGEHVPTLPLILKIARALKCSSAHLMTLTEAKLAESAPSAD